MDRTALITGGTGGLGAAVTAAFRAAGWRAVVPWVDASELERVDRGDEGLTLVEADLFGEEGARAAVGAAGPSLRAVVNLVGGFASGGPVHETPLEAFERMLTLNLRPAFLVTAAAAPVLLEAGGGAIVCVSSRITQRPFPGAAGAITAKAAVRGFVGAAAADYRAHGIRVNAVEPDLIDTPANRAASPQLADKMVAPTQIAEAILFLCDDRSGATTGAVLPVYGRG